MGEEYPRPAGLAALLRHDAAHRKVGVTGGLVPLEALEPRDWDGAEPVVLPDRAARGFRARAVRRSSAEFAQAFYKKHPFLAGVPLDGLLVAGAAVGEIVDHQGGWESKDVDVFLHGHPTAAAAEARLKKFLADLDAAYHAGKRAALLAELTAAAQKVARKLARPGRAIEPQLEREHAALEAYIAARETWVFRPVDEDSRNVYEEDRVMALEPPPGVSAEAGLAVGRALASECLPPGTVGYSVGVTVSYRTRGCLTVLLPADAGAGGAKPYQLQVIFRHYRSPSEVLHGFDLGSSAVGFDGATVWLTALGRLAYEAKVNVVDPARCNSTYEKRLAKYAGRGFGLVMPGLDLAALPTAGLRHGVPGFAALPRCPFSYTAVRGNRVTLGRLFRTCQPDHELGESDYAADDVDEDDSYALTRSAVYRNLRALVQRTGAFLHLTYGAGPGSAADTCAGPPYLTAAMVRTMYDRRLAKAVRPASLNLTTIESYYPDVKDALFARVQKDGAGARLEDLREAQTEKAASLLEAYLAAGDYGIRWITDNPGGQGALLSSSVKVVTITEAEWYGPLARGRPAAEE